MVDAKVSGLSVVDDGTNFVISANGIVILKIRKSDKQLLISAGMDTDGNF